MKKIYVGNLPWSASEQDLRDFFSKYGPVNSVSVAMDRETRRSRGFGFIEMSDADADRAIAEANGKELGGRALRINDAEDPPPSPSPRRR